MLDKDIIEDINYRLKVNNNIKNLEEQVKDGVYDDNPLIDLVLFYKREIDQLTEENERLLQKINQSDKKE